MKLNIFTIICIIISYSLSQADQDKYIVLPSSVSVKQLAIALYDSPDQADNIIKLNKLTEDENLAANTPLYLNINPLFEPLVIEQRLYNPEASIDPADVDIILFNLPDWNLSAFPKRHNNTVQIISATSLISVSYILYGTTKYYKKIAEWNNIKDPTKIFIRQYLYLEKDPINDLDLGHEKFKQWAAKKYFFKPFLELPSQNIMFLSKKKIMAVQERAPLSLERYLKNLATSKNNVNVDTAKESKLEIPAKALSTEIAPPPEKEIPFSTEVLIDEKIFTKPAWVVSFNNSVNERNPQSTLPSSTSISIEDIAPIKKHNLLISTGYGFNSMQENMNNNQMDLQFQTLAIDLFYRYIFAPPHWHLDLNLRGNYSISQQGSLSNGGAEYSISDLPHFINFDARIGYAFSVIEEPWRFMLMAGAFSSHLFNMQPFHGGFNQISYFQLYPTLRRLFQNGDSLQLYMKIIPTGDVDNISRKNTYFSLGTTWQSFSKKLPFSIGIEYSEAFLPLGTNNIKLQHTLLTFGLQI